MVTQKLIKKLFSYEDGKLIRRIGRSGGGKVGSPAGHYNDSGYLIVGIGGSAHRVHRLVFLYHYGYIPTNIDHINGVRDDNRIENLRACTISQNGFNMKARENCSSKFKGVSWSKERRLWEAYVNTGNIRKRLGRFWDEEVAAQIVSIERVRSHKEFANNG